MPTTKAATKSHKNSTNSQRMTTT